MTVHFTEDGRETICGLVVGEIPADGYTIDPDLADCPSCTDLLDALFQENSWLSARNTEGGFESPAIGYAVLDTSPRSARQNLPTEDSA